jgi:hypothetical protein
MTIDDEIVESGPQNLKMKQTSPAIAESYKLGEGYWRSKIQGGITLKCY